MIVFYRWKEVLSALSCEMIGIWFANLGLQIIFQSFRSSVHSIPLFIYKKLSYLVLICEWIYRKINNFTINTINLFSIVFRNMNFLDGLYVDIICNISRKFQEIIDKLNWIEVRLSWKNPYCFFFKEKYFLLIIHEIKLNAVSEKSAGFLLFPLFEKENSYLSIPRWKHFTKNMRNSTL